MKWLRFTIAALRWADHLDDEGFYKNKRFFLQAVALLVLLAANFGLDIQIGEAEKVAIVGGIMALVDIGTRAVGRKVDAKKAPVEPEIHGDVPHVPRHKHKR